MYGSLKTHVSYLGCRVVVFKPLLLTDSAVKTYTSSKAFDHPHQQWPCYTPEHHKVANRNRQVPHYTDTNISGVQEMQDQFCAAAGKGLFGKGIKVRGDQKLDKEWLEGLQAVDLPPVDTLMQTCLLQPIQEQVML